MADRKANPALFTIVYSLYNSHPKKATFTEKSFFHKRRSYAETALRCRQPSFVAKDETIDIQSSKEIGLST